MIKKAKSYHHCSSNVEPLLYSYETRAENWRREEDIVWIMYVPIKGFGFYGATQHRVQLKINAINIPLDTFALISNLEKRIHIKRPILLLLPGQCYRGRPEAIRNHKYLMNRELISCSLCSQQEPTVTKLMSWPTIHLSAHKTLPQLTPLCSEALPGSSCHPIHHHLPLDWMQQQSLQ